MLLDNIDSPKDVRALGLTDLSVLAAEVRQRMLEVVSATGGHLASSLGAVEITIALHYCLNTPQDIIVWDVGHQSYAHKILTGRNRQFMRLRQYKGLSGFPCKEESEYDVFTTGHSSTAVSLALGLSCAAESAPLTKKNKIVAVIGDGSLSGGLCFEGLNQAGHLKKDLLVVLNTNELSIAPNVGAISTYLNKLISQPLYNRFRSSLEEFVSSRIPKGSRLIRIANKFEEGLKSLFVPGMLFEELGFRYFGPFDGHNLNLLIQTLRNILPLKGPLLLHVVTKKGKGYKPAQENPVKFHSVPPFDIKTGDVVAHSQFDAKTYTKVFSDKLSELASLNKKIVAITAAMPEGTGLDKFRDLYPERFYDVGIAESHAVCFAAGLATKGFIPVVAIYSTFLQRAFDQIVECAALQNIGIIFAIDRAGVVGEDGSTHQGVFDIAFLSGIPNLTVMSPKDGKEIEQMLEFAVNLNRPVAIRYPKAYCPELNLRNPDSAIELGKAELLKEGNDACLLSYGSMVNNSLKAAQLLSSENINVGVINIRFAKPLDMNLLTKICGKTDHIFSVEDGVICGGLGSKLAQELNRKIFCLGLPDEFVPCGKRDQLLDLYGLSAEGIAKTVRRTIKKAPVKTVL